MLREIGNHIGCLLLWRKNFWALSNKKATWVFVEVDIRDMLREKNEVVGGDVVLLQALDYWKITFRCAKCHKVRLMWKEWRDHIPH